jgi:hypothetical protein
MGCGECVEMGDEAVSATGEAGGSRSLELCESFVRFFFNKPPKFRMEQPGRSWNGGEEAQMDNLPVTHSWLLPTQKDLPPDDAVVGTAAGEGWQGSGVMWGLGLLYLWGIVSGTQPPIAG